VQQETTATEPTTQRAMGASVVPLLALAVFLNYADRGNLATAAPLIKSELHLTGTQIGLVLSAFFWSYVPAQFLAGYLVDRINAYRTLALGVALWSAATAAMGLAGGYTSLLVLRLLLGLGESAAFPCIGKLLGQHLPAHKLGAANGITLIGVGLGPAFGTFVGGLLMAKFGWRFTFVLFGVVTIMWLVPWRGTMREAAINAASHRPPPAPAFMDILRLRAFWGTALGHFGGLYAFYFIILWMPLYLVKARGFSVSGMAELVGLIYVVYAVSTFATGLVSDRAIAAGAAVTTVRKAGAVGGLALGALCLTGAAFGSSTMSIISLFGAGIAFGLGTANVYTIPQTLAGAGAAGKWVALENGFGNAGGIVAPIVTGLIIDQTGQFFWAFLAAAAMAVLGMVGWGIVVKSVTPVQWEARRGLRPSVPPRRARTHLLK
jgi:MFS family permease